MSKKALLLIGSPKGEKSTSHSLGSYLTGRLSDLGVGIDKLTLVPTIKTEDGIATLLSKVNDADIIILASPLYVDQFPSFVIRSMELIYEHKKALNAPKKQRLLAIVNCGFPEATQIQCASAISRHFALRSGMEWAGCLSVGMGPAIRGEPLYSAGEMVNNLAKGLMLTAEALVDDKPVPVEAISLVSKPFMPLSIYTDIANRNFDNIAKATGILDKMGDKPYG